MLYLLLKNRLNTIFLGYTRDEPKKKAGRIIGTLIGMAAVRFINPGRAKEILAFVGGLFGLLIWLSSKLMARFGENLAPQLKNMGIEDIKQYITAVFSKPFLKFFPSTW